MIDPFNIMEVVVIRNVLLLSDQKKYSRPICVNEPQCGCVGGLPNSVDL